MDKAKLHEQYKNPPVSPLKRHTATFSNIDMLDNFCQRNQLENFIVELHWVGSGPQYKVIWDSIRERSEFR